MHERLQDPFGNYVVQYVLDLGQGDATGRIMKELEGHYPELSQQKFSSNVVEKCLKLSGPQLADARERVIREILTSNMLPRLLQVSPVIQLVIQCLPNIPWFVLELRIICTAEATAELHRSAPIQGKFGRHCVISTLWRFNTFSGNVDGASFAPFLSSLAAYICCVMCYQQLVQSCLRCGTCPSGRSGRILLKLGS